MTETFGVVMSTFLLSSVESAVAALPNVMLPISPSASCSSGVNTSSTVGSDAVSWLACLSRASISSWDK
ncbi:hypothetical protein DJ90_6341 [Paenibacillus macerans]|uniref:Secreted protein n=1 Tax=Paenibacillus macerans TaxID=44252 RepID=A0A090YA25_PAEMA|nr:hypothetical protein DJ90_6341 [Paenibacillus macerans]